LDAEPLCNAQRTEQLYEHGLGVSGATSHAGLLKKQLETATELDAFYSLQSFSWQLLMALALTN